MPDQPLDLMPIQEALRWIGEEALRLGHQICARTLALMRVQGLPVHELGGRTFISKSEFIAWIATRKMVGPAPTASRKRGRPRKSATATAPSPLKSQFPRLRRPSKRLKTVHVPPRISLDHQEG